MLSFVKVIRHFQVMSKLADTECVPYHELIRITMDELERKIKPQVDMKKYESLLSQLAGAAAYYRYMVMTNMISGNVSALDLSISMDHSKQIMAAKRLRDELTIMAKHLLCDDHFVFHTV